MVKTILEKNIGFQGRSMIVSEDVRIEELKVRDSERCSIYLPRLLRAFKQLKHNLFIKELKET